MKLCVRGALLAAGIWGKSFPSLSHADFQRSRGESTHPALCPDKTLLVDSHICVPSSLEQEAASCKTCSDHTAAFSELCLCCAVEQLSCSDIPTVSLSGLKQYTAFWSQKCNAAHHSCRVQLKKEGSRTSACCG